ncbi:MAG: sugar dehydrogenase [Acidimicrobiaceae bacterium]|jgi:glucose/arabinose dehydrogenase|nr:sugar dehydrogenase [Acidimicrobiaceae bacterium]MBT5580544.1 sugar dehydrogenase [Acidimicrobiaceae bacterium]MBT5849041.1 sugar dehydrogenase [Acidimicrobiaceae bacterium]
MIVSCLLFAGCGSDDPVETVFSTPVTVAASEETVTAEPSEPSQADADAASATESEPIDPDEEVADPDEEAPTPTTTLPPAVIGPDQAVLDSINVTSQPIAIVEQAIALAFHPTNGTVLLAQRTGLVVDFTNGRVGRTQIDFGDDLSLAGESGLLSLTYDPAAEYLYVSYTNADDDTRIVAYPVDEDGLPDAQSGQVILALEQPEIIHNGGHIEFGPDGYLYVALGDGGPANDPEDRAQRLSSLFGKILRIDPQPGSEPAYLIPEDNPFVTVDGAAGEVWAYGLRNPWRFSFDRATGDFYTGDVGQYVVEEINYVEAGVTGANFGWARLEGPIQRGATPPDHVAPLSFYNHDDGRCAIVAGIVYRGTAIPELRGAFIYGDYCDGQVRAMTQIDGEVVATRTLGIFTGQLTGFAQDLGGELYVFNLAGETLKIVPG